MIYLNKHTPAKAKTKEVSISFAQKDTLAEDLKEGKGELVYNITINKGALRSGLGFENLASAVDTVNIDTEVTLPLRGNQVKAINQLCWHDETDDITSYYIFYYNNEGLICYDGLYEERLIPSTIQNNFTDIPITFPYKTNGVECLVFSGKGTTVLIGSGGSRTLEKVPGMLSCVSHYGMFFGIKIHTPPKLIYSPVTDLTKWDDTLVKNLDFTDARGELTRLVSFNDYVYIFRNYGITQLSKYSQDEEFSISHMYQACSYINPNTICQFKDAVYFVEDCTLKAFNGNSVKDIEVKNFKYMKGVTNTALFGTCYKGKYYLACRCAFGDNEVVGCEGYSAGYTNNALISYDLTTGEEEVLRGVDINQIMNFVTPFKSKLLACFRNQHIDKIGQLTSNGKIFGQSLKSKFESTYTDFGAKSARKTLTKITYKCSGKVACKIICDGQEKTFTLDGNGVMKTKRLSLTGREFKFILTGNLAPINLDDFVVTAKIRDEN